jgi:hypothetical protein
MKFARALVALLCLPAAAYSAELRDITVEKVDGRYVLNSEVWFGVGIDALFAVFLDYDLSTQFSSAIVEARDIEPDAQGRPRFYIRNRGCVLFFCFSAERNGYVLHEPNVVIEAFADPETSDFHLSEESWRFREDGDGTIVDYHLEMKPKMWIPPVIGTYVIKRRLREGGGYAIQRIEAIARAMEQRR